MSDEPEVLTIKRVSKIVRSMVLMPYKGRTTILVRETMITLPRVSFLDGADEAQVAG